MAVVEQTTFAMHGADACWVSALTSGDLVALDPFYGAERVEHAYPYQLTNGVECVHLQLSFATPIDSTGALKTRFVVRGAHEPVTRYAPVDES